MMGNLTEDTVWSPTIYEIEYDTPVLGGSPEFSGSVPVGGYSNVATQQLANRTQFLLEKATINELSIEAVEDRVSIVEVSTDEHYGSVGVNAHGTASESAPGFMSIEHYNKLESLAPVAISGDYEELSNKPPFYLSPRSGDFTARKGYRYYIKQSMQVVLEDPIVAGYIDGDFIQFIRSPNTAVSITSTNANIITGGGTTTEVAYDIDDEITIVFDGINWRV